MTTNQTTEESDVLHDAYVRQPMLTCIGNKRKLLQFLEQIIKDIRKDIGRKLKTMDACVGSGVVARMLTRHSTILLCNDLEEYAVAMARCYLQRPSESQRNRIRQHIEQMNKLARGGPFIKEGIIASHYAPQNTDEIRVGERCFYTHENALIIDTLRCYVDEHVESELRDYCIAPLLVKCSIHTNTCGVFKGFYKNKNNVGCFGGEKQNALQRIKKRIELDEPIPPHFPCKDVRVSCGDACDVIARLPESDTADILDVIYVDPPYNQHPYGSNYFMLNVILRNEVPDKISKVSGIPKDWNRSPYNYKRNLLRTFERLLDIASTRTRYLLISYNNEGLVADEQWKELLKGYQYTQHSEDYCCFKGSRNLSAREQKVKEFVYKIKFSD